MGRYKVRKRIVGYSVSDKVDSQLVISALDMASSLRGKSKALMFHSDQGCQYLSAAFRHRLSRCGILQSVSRRGNCWDNVPTEHLFRSLKSEWIFVGGYRRLAEAKSDTFCYLFDYYNQRRPYSFNAGLPPAIAEQPKLVFKNT
jgi:putative transposase